ncbi:hypothetical protein [Sphingomonas sp.]|uniref:hypothetical protein n=1 Tax=Sphingomonas sp. TaxID=28214 RepID=UPI003BAAF744
MSDNPLIMHPPRLSDLKGDALRSALKQRHEDNKGRWLVVRKQRSVLARIRDWVFG